MTGNYGQQGRGNVTLFSVISTPILILVLATVLLVYNLIGLIGVLVNGGEIVYAEETLNNYINTTYDNSFKNSSAKNSGLVLMFFYNEDTNTMEYTVKAGSNVSTYASAVFGTDSKFGAYLEKNLKMENYKATFGDTLAAAIDQMAKDIEELKLMSNYVYEHDVSKMPVPQATVKKGAGDIFSNETADKISAALVRFQAETGLYMVMSLDTSVNAFGRTIPTTDIFMVVLIMFVIALCSFNLVKKVREYKRYKNDFGTQEQSRIRVNARSPYYDEDEDDEAPATEEEAEEEELDEEIFEVEEDDEAEGIVTEDVEAPASNEENSEEENKAEAEEENPAPRRIRPDIFNALALAEAEGEAEENEEENNNNTEDDEDLESEETEGEAEEGLDYDVEYDYEDGEDVDESEDFEGNEETEEADEDELLDNE